MQGNKRLQKVDKETPFVPSTEPSKEAVSNLAVIDSSERRPFRTSFKFKIKVKEEPQSKEPTSHEQQNIQFNFERNSREVLTLENGPKRLKIKGPSIQGIDPQLN